MILSIPEGLGEGPNSRLIVDHSAICLPFYTTVCQQIHHRQCSTIMWHHRKNVYVQSRSAFCREGGISAAARSLLTTTSLFLATALILSVSFFCQQPLWFGLRTNAPFLSFFLAKCPCKLLYLKLVLQTLTNYCFERRDGCLQIHGI